MRHDQQFFWRVQFGCCRDATEIGDLCCVCARLESRTNRFKGLAHGFILLFVSLRCRAYVRGAIDINPEVFIAPLGFKDGDFTARKRTADGGAEQVRAEDQIIGAAEQHRATGQRINVAIDHKVRYRFFDL